MPLTTCVYPRVITNASQGRSVLSLSFVHLHHVHCSASSYNKLSACSSRWLHSTSAGYSSSSQTRVLYLGTLSTARMVSTWVTFTSAPIQCTLNMQHISLDYLQKLITEGAFMPSVAEGTLELSGMTVILLILQVDDQHEQITDVYVGLVVCHVESCLYAPEKILDFVSDIEVNLKVACDALKAGCDLGKRHTFCLFVNNYGGVMSVPTDLPYCLIYPTSYVKDMELDDFDTHNNPTGTHVCCCICHATLQYMNDNPHYCRAYSGSCLILPRGAQYKERFFPEILELQNHWVPLIDSVTKEPFPMKLMGDFR